jgi:hypothetical protein
MYCPKCGTYNADQASHCVQCGRELRPPEENVQDQAAPPQPQGPGPQPRFTPGYGQQPPRSINNFLIPAILVTIFCCPPFGIIAIVYAAQVNGKIAMGDYQSATSMAGKAKTWSLVALIAGLVIIVASVVLSLALEGGYY